MTVCHFIFKIFSISLVIFLDVGLVNEEYVSFYPIEKELYVNLDKTQLIRIVTNLIKNATQAVEEEKKPKINKKKL